MGGAKISQRLLRGLAHLDEFLACWPLIAEGSWSWCAPSCDRPVWSSCAMRALMSSRSARLSSGRASMLVDVGRCTCHTLRTSQRVLQVGAIKKP
jgi:hypothetical protein